MSNEAAPVEPTPETTQLPVAPDTLRSLGGAAVGIKYNWADGSISIVPPKA